MVQPHGCASTRSWKASTLTLTPDTTKKYERWKQKGAQVAVADVRDVRALRAVFESGRRAYLLNPPAPPSTDIDVEERATVRAILTTLEGSGLEKVVAQSTILKNAGFSDAAAASMAAMTQTILERPIEVERPLRGETTLEQYIARLVGMTPVAMT